MYGSQLSFHSKKWWHICIFTNHSPVDQKVVALLPGALERQGAGIPGSHGSNGKASPGGPPLSWAPWSWAPWDFNGYMMTILCVYIYIYVCVCVCAPILNHGFSFRGISGNLRWLWKIMCSIGKSSINGPCSIARSNNQRAFDVSGDGFRKLWPVNGHDYRQVDVWSLLFKVSKALPLVNNRE